MTLADRITEDMRGDLSKHNRAVYLGEIVIFGCRGPKSARWCFWGSPHERNEMFDGRPFPIPGQPLSELICIHERNTAQLM